ncbi:MAG: hypothetical protein JWM74_2099 [Myxococcaceae bacterium]|nr:hypothetical protein [Myxococcaceae bacterium]
MTAAPPAVDDFHPPYHLGAFGCALVGIWNRAPVLASDELDGFEPLRWRGANVGAAFVLRYDRPPQDHPVVYNEIILANVVRRGAELAAMPFDLALDNPFYVDAGRHHYHLPKRLDATLRIDVERDVAGAPTRITASGDDLAFDAALRSVTLPGANALVSALLRGFTNHVPVIGTASQPHLRALIGVSPDSATAMRAHSVRLAVGARIIRPLGAMFWQRLEVTVGVPRAVAP